MSVKEIALEAIKTDGGTQMRAELSQDVYFDYRDKMLSGVEFDPVEVFHDGSAYWLADGFHRFFGTKEAGKPTIKARVHQGSQRDAILFACGANAAHGLRRTNEDKRIAVKTLLNDPEWVTFSDGKLSDIAAVSQNFVSDLRSQLKSDLSSQAAKAADAPRIGKDGKKRKPPNPKKSKSKPKSQVSAEVEVAVPREPGEDAPEPEHVCPCDRAGKPIPDRPALRKAFRARDLFISSEKARTVVYNNVYEAAALLPDGDKLKADVDKHMKALFHTLATYEPAYVCGGCQGGGCGRCKKRGYTTVK